MKKGINEKEIEIYKNEKIIGEISPLIEKIEVLEKLQSHLYYSDNTSKIEVFLDKKIDSINNEIDTILFKKELILSVPIKISDDENIL